MTVQCCDASGGRVIITIDGIKYSSRSAVTIKPTNIEREAKANMDGTMYVTTKPMPAEADFSMSDTCGLDLETLISKCRIDATFEIFDMNRTYLFSKASVVGRPEIDTETGEIKNIKLASAFVKTVQN